MGKHAPTAVPTAEYCRCSTARNTDKLGVPEVSTTAFTTLKVPCPPSPLTHFPPYRDVRSMLYAFMITASKIMGDIFLPALPCPSRPLPPPPGDLGANPTRRDLGRKRTVYGPIICGYVAWPKYITGGNSGYITGTWVISRLLARGDRILKLA